MDGVVVGAGHNGVGYRHDPTAHAEIVAIRRACRSLGRDDLRGATLYSTLQPRGMCSMASIWCSIRRIVHGARRKDVHAMYFEGRHLDVLDIIDDAFRDDMTATGGVLAGDCARPLYRPEDEPPLREQANVQGREPRPSQILAGLKRVRSDRAAASASSVSRLSLRFRNMSTLPTTMAAAMPSAMPNGPETASIRRPIRKAASV